MSFLPQYQEKPQVKADGEIISVSSTDGYTVTSTLSGFSMFHGNPSRSATGVWSAVLNDGYFAVTDVSVSTILPSGQYVSTQLLPISLDSSGRTVINWVFNSAGTPTDLPQVAHCQFIIHVELTRSSF